jgi:RNA polymerase sigma-B factor
MPRGVHEHERVLFERYRDPDDPLDRDALVERLLPLARVFAARFPRSSEPFDDLYQVACLGLLKAIDRYDTDRGTAFSSYAVPTMLGELRRHLRDKGWPLRVYRNVKELALTVERVVDDITARTGRAPSVAEIAAAIGAGEEDVLEAVQVGQARHAVSLQLPRSPRDGEDETLEDTIGSLEPGYVRTEQRLLLQDLMRGLTRRQRDVVRLRFEHDLCQKEIGDRLGISQMQVSRVLRQAIDRLREVAREREAAELRALVS